MSLWRAGRILAVGGAAALGLMGLVAWEARARAAGTEVRLAMEAVDPRNPLTGHYAAIQLVDPLPGGLPCPPIAEVRPGERAWIVLRRAGDRDRVAAAFATREQAEAFGRGVVVRGRASCAGLPASVRIDIGVERFHADQAEAEALEEMLQTADPGAAPNALAVISVGRDGRARLKGVIAGGRRTDLDWF